MWRNANPLLEKEGWPEGPGWSVRQNSSRMTTPYLRRRRSLPSCSRRGIPPVQFIHTFYDRPSLFRFGSAVLPSRRCSLDVDFDEDVGPAALIATAAVAGGIVDLRSQPILAGFAESCLRDCLASVVAGLFKHLHHFGISDNHWGRGVEF